MITNIQTVLAIPITTFICGDYYTKKRIKAIKELCDLSGFLEILIDKKYGSIKPTFEEIFDEDIIDEIYKKERLSYKYLSIKMEIPIPDEPIVAEDGKNKNEKILIKGDNAIQLHKSFILELVERKLKLFFIALNIADPYCIDTRGGQIIQDGVKSRFETLDYELLYSAKENSLSLGWPEIKKMDFLKVWNWFQNTEGVMNGIGGGSTVRAINAVAHILEGPSYCMPTHLMWAMVGIEALYTKGHGNLIDQVREKTALIFGEVPQVKKRLSSIYDFRSRFIHGDLDFPSPDLYFGDKVDQYNDKLFEAVDTSISILVGSIQFLIHKGWSGFEFPYIVSGSGEAN